MGGVSLTPPRLILISCMLTLRGSPFTAEIYAKRERERAKASKSS